MGGLRDVPDAFSKAVDFFSYSSENSTGGRVGGIGGGGGGGGGGAALLVWIGQVV